MTPAEAVLMDLLLERGYTREQAARALVALEPVDVDARAVLEAPPSEDGEGAGIGGGRRNAIYRHWDDWWCGYSPRNGLHASVEGPWADWVTLARNVVAVEAERRGYLPKPGATP